MINNTTITRASNFVKLACKVPWPEDQRFYVLHQKDVWSDKHKQSIGGTQKRNASLEEWGEFETLVDQHAAPWKRPRLEEPPPLPVSRPACMQGFENTQCQQRSSESSGTQPSAVPNVNKNVKSETVGTPLGVITEDPEYERNMNGLVAQIHKTSGEWFRKSREFQLQVLKSAKNEMTAGSKVEQALQTVIDNGNKHVGEMQAVETAYATRAEVPHSQQCDCKVSVQKINDLVKSGNKLKLFDGVVSKCYRLAA